MSERDADAQPTVVERKRAAERSAREPDDTEPVAEPPAMTEHALDDRYVPRHEIARGGMGRVVEASDLRLGRIVAIKEALAHDGDALGRFARETRITAKLEHPSIVPVYDAGTAASGSPFYVMRKVSGRPLDQLVAAAERLDDRLALLPHVVAACQAIAHAHARGVLHRDLKPTNILVGAHGETVVIDWGLAKVIGETDADDARIPSTLDAGGSLRTRVGTVFGTPGFMAPEQLRAEPVDERADVYALGATLYYVLARRPPHAARSSDEMMTAALDGPAQPVGALVRGIPRELAAIVDKALAYRHAARYPDASALAEDLQRFLTGQLVASHSYTRRERVARFVRKHRALVATIGAALIVFAVGAWLAIDRIVEARDTAVANAQLADAARRREAERADDLLLDHAKRLAEEDPAAAIAMLRPLARSARWREVRGIAAGARAHGVPWQLAGARLRDGAIAPDGHRLVTLDAAGALAIHDLRTRATTSAGTASGGELVRWADDHQLVVVGPAWLERIPLGGGDRVRIPLPADPRPAVAADRGAVFVIANGTLHQLAAGARALVPIAVADTLRELAISPDGTQLAVGGAKHLWLVQRDGARPPEILAEGRASAPAWSDDGRRLVAARATTVVDITLDGLARETSVFGEDAAAFVQLSRGARISRGLFGLRSEGRALAISSSTRMLGFGLERAWSELVIAADPTVIVVVDRDRYTEIPLPAPGLSRVIAARQSPHVVALVGGVAFAWNLEHVMPALLEVAPHVQLVAIPPHDALVIGLDRVDRVDVATGQRAQVLAHGMFASAAYASPSGQRVLLVEVDGTAHLIGGGPPRRLDHPVRAAEFVDEERVVVGTPDGRVLLREVATDRVTTLVGAGPAVGRVVAGHGWIAAALDDGGLWRQELATGRQHRAARLPAPRGGSALSRPRADGTVFVPEGAQLRRWAPGGALELHAAVPGDILQLAHIDDARVLVVTTQGTYEVSLDARDRIRQVASLTSAAVSANGLASSPSERVRGLAVYDAVANVSWRMARSKPPGGSGVLTTDGLYAIASRAPSPAETRASPMHNDRELDVWRLDLPATPDALARALDALTNATYDPRAKAVVWPGTGSPGSGDATTVPR